MSSTVYNHNGILIDNLPEGRGSITEMSRLVYERLGSYRLTVQVSKQSKTREQVLGLRLHSLYIWGG